MIKSIRRSLCFVAVAALPFTLGAGVASAEGVSASHDRLQVDTNTNLTEEDQILADIRVASVDNDGDATGARSRTESSDIQDVENVRKDNRLVSNDEGNESTGLRAILGFDGFDDVRGLDNLDSAIDFVTIDQNNDENTSGSTSQFIGQDDSVNDQQQYEDDAEFVFGQ
jgi:hypothetical protein